MLAASDNPLVDAIRNEVRQKLEPKTWQDCFEQRTRFAIESGELVVSVSNAFLHRWLQRQYRDLLVESARRHLGTAATIRFTVSEEAPAANGSAALPESAALPIPRPADASADKAPPRSEVPAVRQEPSQTRRRFADLADFVPGPGNQLALTALQRMCQQLGAAVNPLVVYGPVGNGKTHLLEGVYRQVRRQSPSLPVLYLTAEAFTNCFTESLREHTLPAFRQRFRTVGVLIVDDIDFLDGKRGVQEEFIHTFKQLHGQGRQIVLAGDRHPRLFSRMSEELITRLLSGMVCRLELPDVGTRESIARKKAAAMGADFSSEILRYVAERFPKSVRELEGALHCLQTWQAMTEKRLTLSAARQALADLERDCVRVVRLADVERVVCDAFGLAPAELRSERRTKALSQPRMLAMYLARRHTPAAYTEIGQFFGGRNHSTVISAERKVGQWMQSEGSLRVASQTCRFSELVGTLEQQLMVG